MIVRLQNNFVVEIVPFSTIKEVEKNYNNDFAFQCVIAPDYVQQNWEYNPDTKKFFDPQLLVIDLKQQYVSLVQTFVHERYSLDDETALLNEKIEATDSGFVVPKKYTEYREYVAECKRKAYNMVYGNES